MEYKVLLSDTTNTSKIQTINNKNEMS